MSCLLLAVLSITPNLSCLWSSIKSVAVAGSRSDPEQKNSIRFVSGFGYLCPVFLVLLVTLLRSNSLLSVAVRHVCHPQSILSKDEGALSGLLQWPDLDPIRN